VTAPHAAVLASAAPGQAHRGRLFRRHLLPGADDLELRRNDKVGVGGGGLQSLKGGLRIAGLDHLRAGPQSVQHAMHRFANEDMVVDDQEPHATDRIGGRVGASAGHGRVGRSSEHTAHTRSEATRGLLDGSL